MSGRVVVCAHEEIKDKKKTTVISLLQKQRRWII
jgi:hypothetical protein